MDNVLSPNRKKPSSTCPSQRENYLEEKHKYHAAAQMAAQIAVDLADIENTQPSSRRNLSEKFSSV